MQVSKAPMPGARFRATAAAAPVHDSALAVVVMGGHHRCERQPDDFQPNDDGNCDEIETVGMFLDTPKAPLFVYSPKEGL
jgi:hypothetical protein